jgi:hypothetical protein
MSERIFVANELPLANVQPPEESGLYIMGGGLLRHGERVDSCGDYEVFWRALPEDITGEVALRGVQRSDISGITVHDGETSLQHTGLAVAFANYLRAARYQRPIAGSRYVTANYQPTPPENAIRIPHLVACQDKDMITDHVVWELLPHNEARGWGGGTLPDQAFIEDRLPDLLELRRTVREQALPDSPEHRELARRLEAGQYISTLFVHKNMSLFGELLAR